MTITRCDGLKGNNVTKMGFKTVILLSSAPDNRSDIYCKKKESHKTNTTDIDLKQLTDLPEHLVGFRSIVNPFYIDLKYVTFLPKTANKWDSFSL